MVSPYLNRPLRPLAQVDIVLEAQDLQDLAKRLKERIGKAQKNATDGETEDCFASAYDSCGDLIGWLQRAEQDARSFERGAA